jgi:hypothetical protein
MMSWVGTREKKKRRRKSVNKEMDLCTFANVLGEGKAVAIDKRIEKRRDGGERVSACETRGGDEEHDEEKMEIKARRRKEQGHK